MKHSIGKTVTAEYDGSSLQHFLRAGMGLTQKEISRAKFLPDGICVDGMQKKVTAQVTAGQRVEVQTEDGEKRSEQLKPSEERLEVLYEDADLIVVNKPSGISIHPSGSQTLSADTLANRLLYYLQEKGEAGVIRIIGRLDKDTSGVVLAAKNRAAAARLERQREQGTLHKTYLALTDGIPQPEQGTVEKWLAPDPADKSRMVVCAENADNGKHAKTHYKIIKKWENRNAALVELKLETGRTHQIRVHMQSIGCPLIGDPLYGKTAGEQAEKNGMKKVEAEQGKRETQMQRTALHAAALNFRQPFTGELLHAEAPLPKDIARFMADVLE